MINVCESNRNIEIKNKIRYNLIMYSLSCVLNIWVSYIKLILCHYKVYGCPHYLQGVSYFSEQGRKICGHPLHSLSVLYPLFYHPFVLYPLSGATHLVNLIS